MRGSAGFLCRLQRWKCTAYEDWDYRWLVLRLSVSTAKSSDSLIMKIVKMTDQFGGHEIAGRENE